MNLKERNDYIREFYYEKCLKSMPSVGDADACKELFENYCMGELDRKGHDYSHGGKIDANRNFKEAAKALGMTPYLIWAVYFYKHMDSILGWFGGNDLKAEGIMSRITDSVNYLLILMGMIKDAGDEGPSLETIVVFFVNTLLRLGCEEVAGRKLDEKDMDMFQTVIEASAENIYECVRNL